jgi:hypothetical protein
MVKKKEKQIEELPEEKDEEQEDTEFVLSATRAPRQGAYERFLAQGLAQTILMTDDLKRVKAVSLCAFMVPDAEREKLATDYQKVKVLNADANALLNSTARKYGDLEVVSVPWGFPETEENYQAFILPWYNCKPFYWPRLLRRHAETWRIWHCIHCTTEVLRAKFPLSDTLRLPNRCPKCHEEMVNHYNGIEQVTTCDHTIVDKEPYWSFFFELSTCLTPEGYDVLKNNFVAWASEPAQQILAELTKMVDPNLYDQILGLYERRGKKGYTDKVKEVAKESIKGESDSEDNMG